MILGSGWKKRFQTADEDLDDSSKSDASQEETLEEEVESESFVEWIRRTTAEAESVMNKLHLADWVHEQRRRTFDGVDTWLVVKMGVGVRLSLIGPQRGAETGDIQQPGGRMSWFPSQSVSLMMEAPWIGDQFRKIERHGSYSKKTSRTERSEIRDLTRTS